MTSEQRAALAAAARAATAGPWTTGGIFGPDTPIPIKWVCGPREKPEHQSGRCIAKYCLVADADYIAMANPKAILELLAMMEAAERRADEIGGRWQRAVGHCIETAEMLAECERVTPEGSARNLS